MTATPTVIIRQLSQRIQNQLSYRFDLPDNCVSYAIINQGVGNIVFDGATVLVPGQSIGANTPDPVATTLIGNFEIRSETAGVNLDISLSFQTRR